MKSLIANIDRDNNKFYIKQNCLKCMCNEMFLVGF